MEPVKAIAEISWGDDEAQRRRFSLGLLILLVTLLQPIAVWVLNTLTDVDGPTLMALSLLSSGGMWVGAVFFSQAPSLAQGDGPKVRRRLRWSGALYVISTFLPWLAPPGAGDELDPATHLGMVAAATLSALFWVLLARALGPVIAVTRPRLARTVSIGVPVAVVFVLLWRTVLIVPYLELLSVLPEQVVSVLPPVLNVVMQWTAHALVLLGVSAAWLDTRRA